MAAVQGIDFNRPLKSSAVMEGEISAVREKVAFLERDRLMAPDVENMRLWASREFWPAAVQSLLPSFN